MREIISNLTFFAIEGSSPKFEPEKRRLAELVGRYSSLRKGIRIVALVWAFIDLIVSGSGTPQLKERMKVLEMKLVCHDQLATFPGLISALKESGRVPHTMVPLRPFLGLNGELRSNSRLQTLKHLEPDTQKPIILGRGSKLGLEILRDIHVRDLRHCGGINTLLAEAGKRFHLIGGRTQARAICHECPWCQRRCNPRPLEIVGPPLHPNRGGLRLRAFAETGVDMAGPFFSETRQDSSQDKDLRDTLCLLRHSSCQYRSGRGRFVRRMPDGL